MEDIDRLQAIPGRKRVPREICLTLADLAGGVPADEAVVEVGVWQGRALAYLAFGARGGEGAPVYGVDERDTVDPTPEDMLRVNNLTDHVQIIRAPVEEAVADSAISEPVGLLYLDGDHSYDGIKAAVAAWLPLLAPDATVVIDGYSGGIVMDVRKAVDDLADDGDLILREVLHGRLAIATPIPPQEPEPEPAPELQPVPEPVALGVDLDLTPANITTPQAGPQPAAEEDTISRQSPIVTQDLIPPPPLSRPPSEPKPKQEDLESLTVSKLIAKAQRMKPPVPLRSGMRKREIIEAIRARSR